MHTKLDTKTFHSYNSYNKFGIKCRINSIDTGFLPHRHDHFEFEFVGNGKILHEINGVSSYIGQGDVYMLCPEDLHTITAIEPAQVYSIGVNYKEVAPIIQKLINSATYPRIAKLESKELNYVKDLFHKILMEKESDDLYSYETIMAYTTLILTKILKNSVGNFEKAPQYKYSYISKATWYISKNYNNNISLEEVADFVHLSPNYFSKLFYDTCRIHFVEYVKEARIKKAKELLSSSDMSITDIAFEVGFGSFSAFSRAFKKTCGCTPNFYRKYSQEEYINSLYTE